jgi:predicted naringenin-chalcone synthase
MFIIGLGTAAPAQRYTQEQCWEAACEWPRFAQLTARSRAIVKRILLGNSGLVSRHLALEPLSEIFQINPDTLCARFAKNAPILAAQAAETALQRAGIKPEAIDAVLISTCTGYLCPGLTSYVSERLGLRADVMALDLVGQGCGAAIPNLQTAQALIGSQQCRTALSVCVEVCSAAFFLDDDPGVLVSGCLFGDGAGAAVLSIEPVAGHRVLEWKTSLSRHSPADRECLRFEQRGGMLRNILRKEVPALAAQYAETLFAAGLTQTALDRSHITGWILHPGGRDVLLTLRERLSLSEADVQWSAAVLREYGNVNSASVLFALDAAVTANAPRGYWWMSSFGAGFSCHGALLRVD